MKKLILHLLKILRQNTLKTLLYIIPFLFFTKYPIELYRESHFCMTGWLVGFKSNFAACGTWDYRGYVLLGGLSKGSYLVFTRVSEKTTENSERLCRQTRPDIAPRTSRLPVLKRRIGQPLVGPRTDSIDIHALPGIRTQDLWCGSRLP